MQDFQWEQDKYSELDSRHDGLFCWGSYLRVFDLRTAESAATYPSLQGSPDPALQGGSNGSLLFMPTGHRALLGWMRTHLWHTDGGKGTDEGQRKIGLYKPMDVAMVGLVYMAHGLKRNGGIFQYCTRFRFRSFTFDVWEPNLNLPHRHLCPSYAPVSLELLLQILDAAVGAVADGGPIHRCEVVIKMHVKSLGMDPIAWRVMIMCALFKESLIRSCRRRVRVITCLCNPWHEIRHHIIPCK